MLFVNKKTPVKKENNVTIKGGSIMNGSLLFNPVQSDIKRTTIDNMSKNNNQSNIEKKCQLYLFNKLFSENISSDHRK